MNERIKKIALQAGFAYEPHKDQLWVSGSTEVMISFGLEKFAELIVQEGAKVVNDTEYPYENESDKNAWDACCVWSATKLKEHFGVEE